MFGGDIQGSFDRETLLQAAIVSILAAIITLVLYWAWFGKRHSRRRRDLEKKLGQAQRTVRDLEEKLLSLEQNDLRMSNKGKDIVIFMDGAFDMMHYGHMNAFRQGKPVCAESERIACVRGCKWVDEVVEHVPYVVDDTYLQYLIEKYNIDYVVHGDDPYIVGRMLLVTRSHHTIAASLDDGDSDGNDSEGQQGSSDYNCVSLELGLRVVYLAGAWDMLHAGHIETLQKAKEFGEYVLVGVHNDSVVNSHRGINLPIMNLHERVLSVLGCKLDMSTDSADSVDDMYALPRQLGILKIVQCSTSLSVVDLVDRIQSQREKYETKAKSEAEFYQQKYNVL
eukprot:gene25925-34520_t